VLARQKVAKRPKVELFERFDHRATRLALTAADGLGRSVQFDRRVGGYPTAKGVQPAAHDIEVADGAEMATSGLHDVQDPLPETIDQRQHLAEAPGGDSGVMHTVAVAIQGAAEVA
jgi:hypothetical protein